MFWIFSEIRYLLGFGSLLSFYGIVSLIIYMLPSSSVGSAGKIVIVAAVLLTLPFALLIGFLVARRGRSEQPEPVAKVEDENVEAPPQKAAVAAAGSYPELAAGAVEVAEFLQSSNLGSGGKHAVYSLPWYLVAGAPRSGKSSLVMSSNLSFQVLPGQRQSEQKFLRPTANVDWRVTSEAVFIDTAGRYQTDGVDAEEWSALLETVKKLRPKRPIDGFILTVNSDSLLKDDERSGEELAKTLRARLDEAVQRFDVKFPVYLVFTHADGLEGFRDSFSASKNEGKTLVWGSTIPLERAENGQAMFDQEYETLQDSIVKRRLVRLSAPFPPVRQLRIFNFPLHFAAARRKFGAFVNALFRPNPFSENPALRGFYFTSAPAAKSGQTPAVVSEGYFSEALFRNVILRDKDLVKTLVAQRQRPPILGWAITAAAAALVLIFLIMSGISLAANRQLLNEAETRGENVLTITRSATRNPTEKRDDETRRELSAGDDLRETLSKLDDYERNGPPLYMRFGLYSGNDIYRKNLLPIYFSVIEQRYKTPTIKRVELELRKFADSRPVANPAKLTDAEEQTLAKYFELLKAYLMLSGEYKDKAVPTQIAAALKEYWGADSGIPSDMKLAAQQQLIFWAKQVDRDGAEGGFPRITLDRKLVEDTRRKLQDFPAVYQYYSQQVSEISKIVDDQIGPTTADAILSRNGADGSFLEGSYAVPSAYTRQGYDLMKKAIADANEKLSENNWVMGDAGKKQVAQTTDAARLQDRYFRDYADNWKNFVKGINVKRYNNKDDATRALQAFSSANSPIKIVLREIAKNTNLSELSEDEGWWAWIKSFVSASTARNTGGSQPEKEFRALFTFVGKKNQKEKVPVETYQGELGKMFNDLNGISDDRLKKIAQQMANDEDPIKLRQRETAIANLLSSFSETPSGQELAILLQKPLGNLRNLLGAGAREQIAKTWKDQILPLAKEVEKGYPFEDGDADADLTKLAGFLNPVDGKLSKFYDERLSTYFEEANGQLRQKDTADVKFSDEFIVYLNNVMALRKALFGAGATPKFEYQFTLRAAKDALTEVNIDGQKITSEGTGSIKGTFPAAGAAETGVQINLASASSGAAALPPSANANSANSGVNNSKPDTTLSSASSLKFPGNWGLFRFVDAGRPQKQPGGEYLLTYSLGGKAVAATIKAGGGDLFDKNVFRQAKAPTTFLK